jgi:SRSO17 transposase
MLPIVGYPTVVSFGLSVFRKVFSRPQSRHFANYLTGLMVCAKRTVKGINDSFPAHLDQSAMNNFITDSTWSDDELDEARHELINTRLKELGFEGGVLIVDDTIAHKTGKKMEGVGIHFDVSESRYTLGHQLVTTHYARGWASVPLDFEIYIRRDKAGEGFKTKLDLAKELIQKAVDRHMPFSCVVFDAWYFNHEMTSFIEELRKDWVASCKGNRHIRVGRRKVRLSEWANGLPKHLFRPMKFKRADGSTKIYYVYEKVVTFAKHRQKVKVFVTYEDLDGEPSFFCTNRLDWGKGKALRRYAKRWEIDAFYRDAKQNLGLEEYELRKLRGVRRHLTMVFIAHALLELGLKRNATLGKLTACLETIGARCRRACAEVLQSLIQTVLKLGEKVRDAKQILGMLSSSRVQLRKMMRGDAAALLSLLKA